MVTLLQVEILVRTTDISCWLWPCHQRQERSYNLLGSDSPISTAAGCPVYWGYHHGTNPPPRAGMLALRVQLCVRPIAETDRPPHGGIDHVSIHRPAPW